MASSPSSNTTQEETTLNKYSSPTSKNIPILKDSFSSKGEGATKNTSVDVKTEVVVSSNENPTIKGDSGSGEDNQAKDENDPSRAKVRWNVEPRLTIMRQAVETVLSGANTTEVAGRFGIPARTLRRYVANEKRRREAGNTDGITLPKKKSKAAALKEQRKRERQLRKERKAAERKKKREEAAAARKKKALEAKAASTAAAAAKVHVVTVPPEMNLRDPMLISDSPLAGPIQPLGLIDNASSYMANKRHRTGSLELFLEALAPVAIKQRNSTSKGKASGFKAKKGKTPQQMWAKPMNTIDTTSILRRDRLDSFGFGSMRRPRKNSLDLFNWALEQQTSTGLGPTGPKALALKSGAEAIAAAEATEAIHVSSLGLSETRLGSGFTSPRFRRPSIDFNIEGDHDCVLMSAADSAFGLPPRTTDTRLS